jgi:hypothetical protein
MPDANQVQQVLKDPNFYGLPIEERTKALSRLDDNFAALPPDEQTKVVSRGIQSTPPPTMPDALAGASQATGIGAYKPGWSDRIMDWIGEKARELRPGTDLSGAFDPNVQARQELAGRVMSGPVTGVPEFTAGAARVMGSKSPDDQRPYYRRALQGATEEIGGLANSLGPVGLVTTPNAVPAAVSYGLGSAALGKATDSLPISPETKDFINTAVPAAVGFRNLLRGDVAPPRARDVLHPTPDVPPGLSPEATARLGTQDVFRAASPSADNPAFRERLSIAAPDLAEIQRQTPLRTSGGFVNPDYRIREFTTNANNYLDDLWNNQRMPQIDRNANAVRSLDPIKQSIFSSISDLDRENYPGAVQAINRKIMAMPDTENLAQLNDRLREVNAQRNSYRGMTPQERAAANITSPQMDALNAEHQALQQVISSELANRGEAGVHDFDKRYGALSEVRDSLQDQMNPAEATRLLDQVKAWVSPGGSAGIHQRIPMMASPGRTLESGLQRLARSSLQTPATPAPNPPRIAGQLPAPRPILAPSPDTSRPVPANERTAPITWTSADIDRVARQTPQAPPPVMPQFAKEGTGTVQPIALGPGTGGPTYQGPLRPASIQAHPALPGPTGPATMPPVPQSNTAPPTLPPLPAPSPINPQELADFTRTLRGMGYQGPVTADNINELLRRANEIRSSMSARGGK